MIDLTENDDPMLFRLQTPAGALVMQWNEVIACLSKLGTQAEPSVADVAAAIRKVSRTPEVAAGCSDEILFAAFARVSKAVDQAGN